MKSVRKILILTGLISKCHPLVCPTSTSDLYVRAELKNFFNNPDKEGEFPAERERERYICSVHGDTFTRRIFAFYDEEGAAYPVSLPP
jgi:hypothetical protein